MDRYVKAADAVAAADTLPQDVPVVRLRSLEPAEVQIAAIRLVPGVGAQEGRVFALDVDPADAGLPEVVQGCPDEVSDDIGKLLNRCPVLQRFPGCGFCADHDAFGVAFVVGAVHGLLVVVAADV